MSKAIVLVSGGLDSLVTASIAAQENDELYFLHFNYRQRTEDKELESFKHISNFYKPKQTKIITIEYIKDLGGNSLTDANLQIPIEHDLNIIPNTYVPFRNGNFLAIAAAWAELLFEDETVKIYIGATQVDGSNYPDCKESFFKKFEIAINEGIKNNIAICTPLMNLSKKDIVILGNKLNAPIEISWSCYSNNKEACGVCDSCYLRLKAFNDAGLKDPIKYK